MDLSTERLRADITENADHGGFETDAGPGRTVLTGSPADGAVRDLFVSKLRAAGLTVRVDAVGNIAGRYAPAGVDASRDPVAVGSHLDSVRRGGIFDGPLGVYAGLEAVRAIDAAGADLSRPVDVVCFTEEEGGRYPSQLGSSVAAGHRDAGDALASTDEEGVALGERLDDIGYRGEDTVDAAAWDAWVELHIEQDTLLEREGVPAGIVGAITGIANCRVDVEGSADHAGSTGMFERADALAAAADVVGAVEAAGREHALDSDGTAVATVGELDVDPNVRNVVPGSVSATLDVRDVDETVMRTLVDRVRTAGARVERERPVTVTVDHYRHDPPTEMSPRCTGAMAAAADAAGVGVCRTHSAGMHDTALVADVTDAGLLFAPSVDGASHSPREWTDWADCAAATRVLAGTVRRLASA
jgi:N-carbamoyl-L-amino-acid hydrolase